MKLNELFVELFFKADTIRLKEFVSALGDLNMSSVMGVFGMGKLYEATKKIMNITDETALSVNQFKYTTGQSAQEFQKWDKWAQQMGARAGTISSTINTLDDAITNLMIHGKDAPTWSMLGIDPTKYKDDFELLRALADKLVGAPEKFQRMILGQLGLSLDLMMILPKIKDNYTDIEAQVSLINGQLEEGEKLHKSIIQLGHEWRDLFVGIGLQISPFINKLLHFAGGIPRLGMSKKPMLQSYMDFASETVSDARGIGKDILRGIGLGGVADFFKPEDIEKKLGDFIFSGISKPDNIAAGSKVYNTTFNISGDNPEDIADTVNKRWNRLHEEIKTAEHGNSPAGSI